MRFRLRSAHYFPGDRWVPGDLENNDKGDDAGTLVGDGTQYPICALSRPVEGAMFPTLEMVPLDAEAELAISEEEARLSANQASMNPVDRLPLQMDDYESRYIPGFGTKRPAKKEA